MQRYNENGNVSHDSAQHDMTVKYTLLDVLVYLS